jgi:Zn ribbon nucleic-acid-binding protein
MNKDCRYIGYECPQCRGSDTIGPINNPPGEMLFECGSCKHQFTKTDLRRQMSLDLLKPDLLKHVDKVEERG